MTSKALYIIRLDDACPTMHHAAWTRLEEAFNRLNIQPIVGVIPDNRDPEIFCDTARDDFWSLVKKWDAKGWAIALHGLHHSYHSTLNQGKALIPLHDKSEFVGLSLEQQGAIIRSAYSIFLDHSVKPSVFMAPSHSFDDNTLKALYLETDIRIITDGYALYPYLNKEFVWVPQQLWRLRSMPFGVWTVCLHPNGMSESAVNQAISRMEHFRENIINVSNVVDSCQRLKGFSDLLFEKMFIFALKLKRQLHASQ